MIKNLNIGKVQLENNIILAPMAGITDLTFRTICKEFGIGLVTTEMISAKGLYYKDKKTEQLMKINPKNRPVSMQIFGNDAEIMAFIVDSILNKNDEFDIIDINMGCPAPKIVKNNDGCALMKNPQLAGQIVKKIKAVSNKPVTVKFRSGWDENNINAVEFAKVIEQNGADAITVHGRTREQFYSGKSDYNIIKEVKLNVSIPVIGNGDIFTPDDAIKIFKETNCDGIMLGRGVLGNPWLIHNILCTIKGNDDVIIPTPIERIKMLKKHATMLSDELPEKLTVLEMRKHAGWYIKGLKKSSEVRSEINRICNLEVLYEYLEQYINTLNDTLNS